MSKYKELGVDADKSSVREAFKGVVDNEFPHAFVNILRDPEIPGGVFTQHMDGDGSKFIQRLLNFYETGDERVLRGAADDALQMNLGDIAAAGFVFGPITVTDVININGINVPKDIIMAQLSSRFNELIELHRQHGFTINFLGGETADLPDQVKSIAFDVAVHARAKEVDIIKGNVQPGDIIYGFASDGKAVWEDEYNSGIMSNGLTLARTHTMWKGYTEKYPHLVRANGGYQGRFKVGERSDKALYSIVSDAIVSPTRQWSILMMRLLSKLKARNLQEHIHGASLNTGGGATKIANVGTGITYIKRMPPVPEIFALLQRESGEEWNDMFRDFNCGVGMDIVCSDDPRVYQSLLETSKETGIKLFKLGECVTSIDGQNHVDLRTGQGDFEY